MQTGLTLQELAGEIVTRAKSNSDILADNSQITSTHLGNSYDGYQHAIKVGDHTLRPNTVFEGQLSQKLRIPKTYYDRMAEEAPFLLDKNINQWLHSDELRDRRRMIRTNDINARAYLGAGYRHLDYVDVAETVLPKLADMGLEIRSSNITERRMYMQAWSPKLEGEVKVGQVVRAGINISDSEVGEGSLSIDNMIWILDCLNGQISGSVIRKTHAGRSSRHSPGVDIPVEQYMRDETRQLDDAAFFSKVRDAVEYALSPDVFETTLGKMRGAAEIKIAKPTKAVEVVTKQLQLTKEEGESVLANLIEGGDLTKWGMANAVTALAHKSEDYDRAVAMEKAGTTVIDMPKSSWEDALAA